METPDPAGATNPTSGVGSTEQPFLDNGTLRLGTSISRGSSIDLLAPSGGGNLVNIHDKGRLIQQSCYAGQNLDRTAAGQSTSWTPWPWNPIQGGDASNKLSQVVEAGSAEFGGAFFTRTIPLLWDTTTGWYLGATGNPPGGPTSSATMYMAPLRTMRFDRDSIMVYRYWMIYGDLATIRSRVYELHSR